MKKWIKISLVILGFAIISIFIFFIFKAFGITDFSTLKELINKSGKYGYFVYTLIISVMLITLCFVPLLNPTLSILGIALFGAKITFITNMIAVTISTSVLFVIGDKCGEHFATKLVGKKSLDDAQNAIDHKSKFWLPILFIAPGIPDEALCLVAGMTKMKYWYLLSVSLLYHAIEIGIFCFLGSSFIKWSSLSILDWIIIANIILIDIYLLIRFEKYLNNKQKNKCRRPLLKYSEINYKLLIKYLNDRQQRK